MATISDIDPVPVSDSDDVGDATSLSSFIAAASRINSLPLTTLYDSAPYDSGVSYADSGGSIYVSSKREAYYCGGDAPSNRHSSKLEAGYEKITAQQYSGLIEEVDTAYATISSVRLFLSVPEYFLHRFPHSTKDAVRKAVMDRLSDLKDNFNGGRWSPYSGESRLYYKIISKYEHAIEMLSSGLDGDGDNLKEIIDTLLCPVSRKDDLDRHAGFTPSRRKKSRIIED